MKPPVRNAIARIDVIQNGRSVSRGTGFLVADGLVLTAMHVVADRTKDFLAAHPGEITLMFPEIATRAFISHWDRAEDWALLRCELPSSSGGVLHPLPLADLEEEGVEWETYGFPDAEFGDGMVVRGRISNSQGKLDGSHVLQLFSEEAGAGKGAPVRGLSGAPVLVRKSAGNLARKGESRQVVVGVLRSSLMEEHFETVAGTLYACPTASIVRKVGNLLHQRPRALSLRRVSLFVAVFVSISFAIWLGVTHLRDSTSSPTPPSKSQDGGQKTKPEKPAGVGTGSTLATSNKLTPQFAGTWELIEWTTNGVEQPIPKEQPLVITQNQGIVHIGGRDLQITPVGTITHKDFYAHDDKYGHVVPSEDQADLVDTLTWRIEGSILVFETNFYYKATYGGHAPGTEFRVMRYRRIIPE